MNKRHWLFVITHDKLPLVKAYSCCQFTKAKRSYSLKLQHNDMVIYYASRESCLSKVPYQKFCAIGLVADHEPTAVTLQDGSVGYRRQVNLWDGVQEVSILPLIPDLPFIRNKTHWGYPLRFGVVELDPPSAYLIAEKMLSSTQN